MSSASRPEDEALARADGILLQRVDAQMAHAYALGGAHLACRPGCSECCIGPFGINALEAWRLRRGLERLRRSDAAAAEGIEARARAVRQRLGVGFPGNPESGELVPDDALVEAFLDRHGDVPCPVLNEAGHCLLYEHRPITCRSYGPPVCIGGEDQPPCRLCFETVPEADLPAYRVELDAEGLEETVLEALERDCDGNGQTLIAFALTAAQD